MRVQRVVMPVTEVESWTVLGDDGDPVAELESFLAYLTAIERSPNTVWAYALSLKVWFEFLAATGLVFDAVAVDDVARFVAWLRAPTVGVIVMEGGTSRRQPATAPRPQRRHTRACRRRPGRQS